MKLREIKWCVDCSHNCWHRRTLFFGWRCQSCGRRHPEP